MQKNLRLAILVMLLSSVFLFLLIVGPQVRDATAAGHDGYPVAVESGTDDSTAGEAVDAAVTGIGTSAPENIDSRDPEILDSIGEPTGPAIQKDPYDVTAEITEPKMAFQLKYDKYPLTYTYLLVDKAVNVRTGPALTEAKLKVAQKNEKLSYIETVTWPDGVQWYHITWQQNGRQLFGFVSADAVTKRVFQFNKAYDAVLKAEQSAAEGPLTYINNYHNLKGSSPLYHGGETDSTGGRRSQSAPGYPNLADLKEFSYLGDGTLVKVLSSGSQYTRVSLVYDGKNYFVPNKYVATPPAIAAVKKAVVIDRANQNEVVFEKIGGEWKVISYTLATTGTTGEYHQPTPLGFFYGIEKRERFYYYKDGTTSIQGYAPYAVRFAGGAYMHGVPVNYKYNSNGSRIDPGKVEYSGTMGTVPLSHKCVRNYTSHAKFVYDWYTPGEVAVIVIE